MCILVRWCRPVERHLCAPIAQQAERLHGKEKVCGSIPHGGSGLRLRCHRASAEYAVYSDRCPTGETGSGDHSGIAQAVEQAAHNRCVAGSSPAPATRHDTHQEDSEDTTMAKTVDVRPKITLACTQCKERNYITKKNRRNDPDRLELKKFCPRCKTHTPHRETR